jgi:hypothetical protein
MPDCGFSLRSAPKLACQTGPSLIARRLSLLPASPSRGTSLPPSKIPAIRFAQSVNFVAYTVHAFASACQVACPLVRIRPVSRPSGTFTTRLPTGRSPFPLLVITTTATGLLCWWDLHPLEWQLASLHQSLRQKKHSLLTNFRGPRANEDT